MSVEASLITLPAVLDLRAAPPLKADIQAHKGVPLEIDASKVERLGALCLQVLLTVAAAWPLAGCTLRITAASDAFCDDVRLMGAGSKLGVKANPGSASC